MSTFPGSVDSFATKVDHVTPILANDVNSLQDSVVAIETALKTNYAHSLRTATEAELVSGIDASLSEGILVTLTASRVMGVPLNGVAGQRLHLVLTEGGAGGFALTFGAGITVTNFGLNMGVGAKTDAFLTCISAGQWVIWSPSVSGQDITPRSVTVGPFAPDPSGRPLSISLGDNVDLDNILSGTTAPTGQLVQMSVGTAATPDTTLNPPLRVVRTSKVLGSQATGTDGSEFLNAITGGIVLDVADEVQGEGVYGWALTRSTAAAASGHTADAVGGYFTAASTGSSIHCGMGLFASGYVNSATGFASALQLDVSNGTGVAHAVVGGSSAITQGIYLTADGTARVGAGIEIHNSTQQFETGIYFGSKNLSGHIGPTDVADIRSDSHATTSIQINGTHTNAIMTAAGAGWSGFTDGLVAWGFLSLNTGNLTLGGVASQLKLTGASGTTALRVNGTTLEFLNQAQTFVNFKILDAGDVVTRGALNIGSRPAFAASDKYLVVDSSGNVHVSGLGPAS